MIIYSLVFLSGLSIGILLYWLFDKKIKITVSTREDKQTKISALKQIREIHQEKNKLFPDDRLYKATCLINEIKSKGDLPFKVSPAVLHSLTVISQTSNWQQQLDEESLQNLNRIYDKWQRHIKAKKANIQRAGEAVNMEAPKYWEGTEEEYFNALEEGIIDENTKVNIIIDEKNYHGSWITRNADGSMEEYME